MKMPASERADKQQQLDQFRELLASPMFGSAVAEKCGENIRIEMQRDRYGCYGARARSAGVKTACTLVTADDLSAIVERRVSAGRSGNSTCTYDIAALRPVSLTIEVAWTGGRDHMEAWRAGVRRVTQELKKHNPDPPVGAQMISGLGDDAYYVEAGPMPFLAVRRGDTAFTLQALLEQDTLAAIARKVLERLQ